VVALPEIVKRGFRLKPIEIGNSWGDWLIQSPNGVIYGCNSNWKVLWSTSIPARVIDFDLQSDRLAVLSSKVESQEAGSLGSPDRKQSLSVIKLKKDEVDATTLKIKHQLWVTMDLDRPFQYVRLVDGPPSSPSVYLTSSSLLGQSVLAVKIGEKLEKAWDHKLDEVGAKHLAPAAWGSGLFLSWQSKGAHLIGLMPDGKLAVNMELDRDFKTYMTDIVKSKGALVYALIASPDLKSDDGGEGWIGAWSVEAPN